MSEYEIAEALYHGLRDEDRRVLDRYRENVRSAAKEVVARFSRSAEETVRKLEKASLDEFGEAFEKIVAEQKRWADRVESARAAVSKHADALEVIVKEAEPDTQALATQVKGLVKTAKSLDKELKELHRRVEDLGRKSGVAGASWIKSVLKL